VATGSCSGAYPTMPLTAGSNAACSLSQPISDFVQPWGAQSLGVPQVYVRIKRHADRCGGSHLLSISTPVPGLSGAT
jgi:hypothetical protein